MRQSPVSCFSLKSLLINRNNFLRIEHQTNIFKRRKFLESFSKICHTFIANWRTARGVEVLKSENLFNTIISWVLLFSMTWQDCPNLQKNSHRIYLKFVQNYWVWDFIIRNTLPTEVEIYIFEIFEILESLSNAPKTNTCNRVAALKISRK